LFKAYSSPLGAVVMGVTAGFGEELLSRGILLPRLGIFLSSIFFAAMHAYQYNWDNLINVFLFGVVLGIIRKKTSTSVCVIIHGGYDFVLCIICLLSK
jgi:membrane protease YdiL (CAAX protease family)